MNRAIHQFLQKCARIITEVYLWVFKRSKDAASKILYRGQSVEDFPEHFEPFMIYIAGDAPHEWGAALTCPCACGDTIQLNLIKEASPCWTIVKHSDETISVRPSVWRQKGCGSHFFIRHSQIVWYHPTYYDQGEIQKR
jgi:hypothetical protein